MNSKITFSFLIVIFSVDVSSLNSDPVIIVSWDLVCRASLATPFYICSQ